MTAGPVHYRTFGHVLAEQDGAMLRAALETPAAPAPASFGKRRLDGHIVQFGQSTIVYPHKAASVRGEREEAYRETFLRSSVRLDPGGQVPFVLRHRAHGGVRVGRVVELDNGPVWCDALIRVDPGPAGDLLLSDLDDAGRYRGAPEGAGLSMGFIPIPNGTRTRRNDLGELEVTRAAVWLVELALVDTPAYPGARLYSKS